MHKGHRKQQRRGFTLVEVLIVVVILGILAATVLPQFTDASADAKESALTQDLQLIRSQIQLYKFQHEGRLPGTTSGMSFEDALLEKTDVTGAANASGPYGPYIVGQLPPNPFNGLRTVTTVSTALSSSDVDGSTGWLYSDTTGEFKVNSDTKLSDGTAAFDL